MFKHLLIPIDFSDASERTFQLCQLLAADASRELLHVVSRQSYSQPPFTSAQFTLSRAHHDQVIESARAQLDNVIQKRVKLGEAKPESLVIEGSVPEEIAKYAQETGKDLIVVSTHGRTGLSRWLMGSVTERLLRLSPCPVLVERCAPPTTPPIIRRILVGVDFSETSMRALRMAARIATRCGAQLHCVHVWSSPYAGYSHAMMSDSSDYWEKSAECQLSEFLQKADLPSSLAMVHRVLPGVPAAKLLEVMEMTPPDLLVLGTHRHSGLKRLALGSVAEITIRYAACTTLVVP